MKNRMTALFIALALAFTTGAFAQAKKDDKAPAAKAPKAAATPAASDADIAAAKAAGKVWVNTGTKVYHKGGQWYGKTKQGKFMTEDEAKKAGFTEDKGEAGKAAKGDAKKADPKKK